MAVFWWTRRGFLSLLFLIGTLGLFGAVLTFAAGNDVFEQAPWLWGLGVALACIVNWIGGARLNHAPLNPFIGKPLDRFTYRAANKFLSLPMEAWSLPLLLVAVFLVVKGIT